MSAITPERQAWAEYANQEMLAIDTMSDEQRTQSIEQLRSACTLPASGLTLKELKPLLQFPGGMTEKELELRAALQLIFAKLPVYDLQSHFTYFYQRDQIMKRLASASTSDNPAVPDCAERANRLILDEIGKTMLRNRVQPQVPKAAAKQNA